MLLVLITIFCLMIALIFARVTYIYNSAISLMIVIVFSILSFSSFIALLATLDNLIASDENRDKDETYKKLLEISLEHDPNPIFIEHAIQFNSSQALNKKI